MQAHAMFAAVWLWWRGSWLGRIALLPIIWVGIVVWKFEGEPAHPVGFHQLRNIVALLGCTVIAWLICGLPMYLRAYRSRAAVRRQAGSTAPLVPAGWLSDRRPGFLARRALLRLSR